MGESVFTTIESARLVLRRFADADLAPFLAYLNDPLVARYQTWESYTEEQARDVIEQQRGREPGLPGQWFTFAADPNVLCVSDVAPSSIVKKAAFEKAVRADKRVSKFLTPPLDPGYHIEIPQPKNA